ncbi:MAG: HIT domain-containing protein [Opitutales bacterium]|nr:HIT domain-containing protein [Opitutales bacterium]
MLKNLHAYWRVDYVETKKSDSDDPFAEIFSQQNDKENLVLLRSLHCFAVLNKYPYNAGHVLVLPNRAISDLDQLSHDEKIDFLDTIIKIENALKKALSPDGFNIGINLGSAAGAGIPKHLHCHIVPRWAGDTNFMPIIGETKVLSQAQEKMFDRIRLFL